MNYAVAEIDPEHTFTSTIVLPDDCRVEVTITVPRRVEWPDVGELAEIAQMSASTARSHIIRSQSTTREMPF